MTQKSPTLITPKMAESAIQGELDFLEIEHRPIEQCTGRILRQDVYPERDNPPFDRVCMDGVAINSLTWRQGARRFAIEASQQAGCPPITLRDARQAIEVMTGAVVPGGTDCIIPMEEFDLDAQGVTLKPNAKGEPYRNIQRRGEDGRPGVAMLKSGTRLGAPELAVVASAGLAKVAISREPRFMVISTGDELIEPGEPIADHQVRRSNAYAVVGALRSRGFQSVGNDHIVDDETMLQARLSIHLEERDILILSGGVSTGKFDLVPKALRQIGVREIFARVAQRPGAPMWFGVGPRKQLVFGLAGNPVATLICLVRYVIPAAMRVMGCIERPLEQIALNAQFKSGRPMAYYLPVSLTLDSAGRPGALPQPTNGPGDFLGLAGTEGFVELPPQPEGFPAGFVAPLRRW
jgi:molybdopterin molybdotransferase